MENIILSPRVGFYSVESISELRRGTAENVSAIVLGKWPKSVVNQEVNGNSRKIILE